MDDHGSKPTRSKKYWPAIQAQIDAMTISQVPLDQLVLSMEQKRKE